MQSFFLFCLIASFAKFACDPVPACELYAEQNLDRLVGVAKVCATILNAMTTRASKKHLAYRTGTAWWKTTTVQKPKVRQLNYRGGGCLSLQEIGITANLNKYGMRWEKQALLSWRAASNRFLLLNNLKQVFPNQGCETSFQGVREASVLMTGNSSICYFPAEFLLSFAVDCRFSLLTLYFVHISSKRLFL